MTSRDVDAILAMLSDDQRLDLRGADLRGIQLVARTLNKANFGEAFMPASDLSHANLRESNFDHAILDHANLYGASLVGATMDHADLSFAKLTCANMQRVSLRHAILRHANLSDANLQQADLTGADLRNAALPQADLRGTDLTRVRVIPLDLGAARLDPWVALAVFDTVQVAAFPSHLCVYQPKLGWPHSPAPRCAIIGRDKRVAQPWSDLNLWQNLTPEEGEWWDSWWLRWRSAIAEIVTEVRSDALRMEADGSA